MDLMISLVHNSNEARNAVIRPSLTKLNSYLQTQGLKTVCISEIGFQCPIIPISEELAATRREMQHILELDWRCYLESPIQMNFVPRISTEMELTQGAIELSLTDKHIRAWDNFLDSDSKLLICLEDDAIFVDDSNFGILEAIVKVRNCDAPSYVDLAGGFDINAIGLGRLFDHQDGRHLYFRKPVTNTTCGYMLNREIVMLFRKIVLNNPLFRLYPADWLINKLLIELENSKVLTKCFHTFPTVLQHGSMKGNLASTIR